MCEAPDECVIERMIANGWETPGERERMKERMKCRSQYEQVCDGQIED